MRNKNRKGGKEDAETDSHSKLPWSGYLGHWWCVRGHKWVVSLRSMAQLLRIGALLAWSLERTQLIQVLGQERGSVSKSPGRRVRRTEVANLPGFSSSTTSRGHYPEKLWGILKQMGIPDHPTCLFRNVYAVQEATGRTGHGTTD